MRPSRTACLVLLWLGACAAPPYEPEPVEHGLPLPGDAFDRVLAVFRDRYARIAVADRERFQVQSAWLPFQRGDVPGRRRASLFRGADGKLRVVVEVSYLSFDGGRPEASPIEGDRPAEQELAGALERALGGAPRPLP